MHPVLTGLATLIALPLLYRVYKLLNWIYKIWYVVGKAVDQFPGEPVKWPFGNMHLVNIKFFFKFSEITCIFLISHNDGNIQIIAIDSHVLSSTDAYI